MFSSKSIVLGLFATLSISTSALAQPAPTWNRSLEGIAILPDPAGGHEIRAYIRISAADLTASANLSTDVLYFRNGSLLATRTHTFSASPSGAGGGCGTSCFTFAPCVCETIGTETFCHCGDYIAPCSGGSGALEPEDEIMVLLRPAPGAVPEQDQSDDQLIQQYHGQPTGWNRAITGVEINPSSAGPGLYDVQVEGEIATNEFSIPGDFSFELQLLVNGTAAASQIVPGQVQPADATCYEFGCGAVCGYGPGGVPRSCDTAFSAPWAGCSCVGGWIWEFPGVESSPGDEIMVILRPAPGALPELPGFEEDEESEDVPDEPACAPDFNADGFVNGLDLGILLAAWGPNAGHPADLNDDGFVNGLDLGILLASWGPCFPV